MYRYFIRLSYKGTNYSGWQIQDNAVSVQQKLNESLSVILNQNVSTLGCGRTDTGVHAKQFYAHFDVMEVINDSPKIMYQLNSVLPPDIAIFDIIKVENTAHARFDALSRSYEYYLSVFKNPFTKGYSMNGHMKPDMNLMNSACAYLIEQTDFSSFSKSRTQVKTNICNIKHASWQTVNEMMVFNITADRFLRGMVRAIVGTLIEVGTGKIRPEEIKDIINSKNRSDAGVSVPASGLFLSQVTYPYLPIINTNSFPA